MIPYRPHPLLRNGHLQTLMLGLNDGAIPDNQAEQHRISLDDGCALLAHEECGPPLADSVPLAILIHGLGGSHRSSFLSRIAYQLRQLNVRVWRLDLRGCGAGLKLAWQPAHAGSSRDLAAVIRAAHQRYPRAPLRLAGFSMGGNILLKMLGETTVRGQSEMLDMSSVELTLALAPPVNLHDCAANMELLSRRIYSRYYVQLLMRQVKERRKYWPQWRAIPIAPRLKSIREFDERYTAPLSGFRNTDHYYSESSADQWLPYIKTPTTIVFDRHDPIVTAKSMSCVKIDPEFVQVEFTTHGGHLGYFGMDGHGHTLRWMEYYVTQRLQNSDRQ